MSNGVTFSDNNGPVTIINEGVSARPSILGKLIEIIATSDNTETNLDRDPAEIETKISFNDLTGHQWLIDDYIKSSLLIDESIEALNQTILNGSTKLKRQMKLFYNRALEKHSIKTKPFDIEKLRKNSDFIVEEVMRSTKKFVKDSTDLGHGYFEEDIDYGVSLITSYCIIECIVLENPNDHS